MSFIDEYMIDSRRRLEDLEQLYAAAFDRSNWSDCLYLNHRMGEILDAMTMGDIGGISDELTANLAEIGEGDE